MQARRSFQVEGHIKAVETVRRAIVLRELIRDWRNGENVEFEDRVQIEDDVVDVFNIPVVGESAVVDVPGVESTVVDVSDGESAVVDVPDGEVPSVESAVAGVPDGEGAGIYVPVVESAVVGVPGGEAVVVTLKFKPVRTKGRPNAKVA
ncbi:hypothetical protein PoB_006746200 [Plakobranchus ocellatus]|uniref:Uncharacterized protein n=1 Tax=Plakobranchus ocellatus TaxID=259542 RepID=A0AAV4DAA1_9GAST|nr:hypothetical protein PoB_006746200 [Plakobranchus ocellatus]